MRDPLMPPAQTDGTSRRRWPIGAGVAALALLAALLAWCTGARQGRPRSYELEVEIEYDEPAPEGAGARRVGSD